TATILLTVFGLTVFLIRGKDSLNIDFVGGTAYGGQLDKAMSIGDLRKELSDDHQKERLKVLKVEEKNDKGTLFEITYDDGDGKTTRRTVQLNNAAPGATREEREANVRQRASYGLGTVHALPDWSVEQIFLTSPTEETSSVGESRFFTIRTSEKDPDLVQVT